jgi:DNA-binding transcriptional LysR family regulator
MNLRQIEVFRAIMLTGSITDAARLLHVSQPGISRLVRHVESRLGMPLFERKRGRIQPTPEARALYAEIEKVYRGVKWIQDYAGGLKSGANALLRVLTTPSAGLELVPRAVAQLANEFPTARIFSEVVTIAQMTELLLAGHADVGVSAMHIDQPALELRQFGEWRLLCIFPAGHPLEAKRRIAVRDALNHRLVSFSKETLQGRIIEGWFDEQQLERKVSVEVRSAHMACALVASGAGVAFVDDLTARAYGPATLLSRPVPSSPVFGLYTVTSRDRPSAVLAKRFCERVASCYRELRKPKPAGAAWDGC